MPTGILSFIRSLGFGGMLGAGLAGLFYATHPNVFIESLRFEAILVIGGLIGAGLHGFIERAMGAMFSPVFRGITFFGELLQILTVYKAGLISVEQRDERIDYVTNQYLSQPDASRKRVSVRVPHTPRKGIAKESKSPAVEQARVERQQR